MERDPRETAELRERLRRMDEYNRQQPRPMIIGLTPEEEKDYRACRKTLKEIADSRKLKVKLPPRISRDEEAKLRGLLKPGVEVLRQAAKGNETAREIVILATDRSPERGSTAPPLDGTAGVFLLSWSPVDIHRGRDAE